MRLRDRLPLIERLSAGPGRSSASPRCSTNFRTSSSWSIDSLAAFAPGDAADWTRSWRPPFGELKALALDRAVAILTTAPLPQLAPEQTAGRPSTISARWGRVKQHADVVLGLFRQDMYEPSRDIEGATELLIRKNRNGPTGYVDLYFYAQWMRFEDMLDPDR